MVDAFSLNSGDRNSEKTPLLLQEQDVELASFKKVEKKPPTPSPYNTEDWWCLYSGIFAFLIAFCISIGISNHLSDLLIKNGEWKNNPLDFFTDSWHYSVNVLLVFLVSGACVTLTLKSTSKPYSPFGFVFIFVVCLVANILAKHKVLHHYGIGSAVWSILIGMLFSNVIFRITYVIQTYATRKNEMTSEAMYDEKSLESPWLADCMPKWIACMTLDEFFIKISLVLLAMDLISSKDILLRSLAVAWIDTPIILAIITLAGVKIFKVDLESSIILAAATSICGTSAATAVGATIKATKDQISYPIAVMSFFTLPLIPLMPLGFTHVLKPDAGWTDEAAGAWIGGTIDTTGAVIASAVMINNTARTTAAVVKMLQNCLIGFICVGISLFWLSRGRKKNNINGDDSNKTSKPTLKEMGKLVWDRLPKFVLGFFAVAIFVSFCIPSSEWRFRVVSLSLYGSGWFESLGFVCIGLNIRITDMIRKLSVMKLIPLYIAGQMLDVLTTGGMAYAVFR